MIIPKSTYRIQFTPWFNFQKALDVIPYLAKLGVHFVYASPIFKARPKSPHGYDIVDHNQLNPDLGTETEFNTLIDSLKSHQIYWLQDIVPNHMAFASENKLLMDVLENGSNSPYFRFFDIEWEHPYESMRGRVLAPFLGHFYAEALEGGEIKLQYDANGFNVSYFELKFPLKIESYTKVLTYNLDFLKTKLGTENNPDFLKFNGAINTISTLPGAEEYEVRCNQILFVKQILWELYSNNSQIKGFIDKNIRTFNAQRQKTKNYDLLDSLLTEQLFRFSFWKVSSEEINYRRFFNINGLISLRLQDDEVFQHIHKLIFKLIEQGHVQGLRVDHIDGLYDPSLYLNKLRNEQNDLYLAVEKILDLKETLNPSWSVQGTTGYDFLNYVNGLFCSKKNAKTFRRIYAEFTGSEMSYDNLLSGKKRLIMGKYMAGNIDNLALAMKKISSHSRYGNDLTLYGLRRALVEVLAYFSIYRTYINQNSSNDTDRFYLEETLKKAKAENPGLWYELDFIEKVFFTQDTNKLTDEEKEYRRAFIMKFQQYTGPLMAKGFEDTFFYVYNMFLSLNEVGGKPNRFGITIEEFHRFNKKRFKYWPHTLNTTSTQDTKRGEDIRARLNVLSEIPKEWEKRVKLWYRLNKNKKKIINGVRVPDKNYEYFLYQTLIGAFPFYEKELPLFKERLKQYLIKAVREAKIHTAWLKPDTDYENRFVEFAEEILLPTGGNAFFKDFISFQQKIAHYGIFNSLSQVLIKITSPGIPDCYQGADLWDLNLVDPDNRRPVDFVKRGKLLDGIIHGAEKNVLNLIKDLLSNKQDGRIKLFLIYKALLLRNQKTGIFQNGRYIPLRPSGKFKDHIITFARKLKNEWVIIVAPRFLTSLIRCDQLPLKQQIWQDTKVILPKASPLAWQDTFIDKEVSSLNNELLIAEILQYFPVALLLGKSDY